jgi:hypothetical protein
MPIVYNNKYQDPVQINDFSLLKFIYRQNENNDFYLVNYRQDLNDISDPTLIHHYIEINSVGIDDDNHITSVEANINNVVWDGGSDYYHRRINYNYIEGTLYDPSISQIQRDRQFIYLEYFIPQFYNWNEKYGILLTVKGSTTNNIYLNKILTINDFNISESRILRNGRFWLESNISKILLTSEELYVQATEILLNEVSNDPTNIGYLYNYPNNYVPIIQEKTFPDFIVTDLSLDDNGFLTIYPKTLENKTLENSLKNYFDYKHDQLVSISIYYVITSKGINYQSDNLENKIIRVANEENNFNYLKVGLDFSDWLNPDDPYQYFPIEVLTVINVDGKIMQRYSSINADFSTQIISFNERNIQPSSLTFQNIEETVTVNQTVIEKPVETKIVKVFQPVFVKFVQQDFKYERVNITFESLTQPAYMIVGDQILSTDFTSDGTYYFNLGKLTPISKDINYELFLTNEEIKIGEGAITVV